MIAFPIFTIEFFFSATRRVKGDTLLFARVGQRMLPGGISCIFVIPIFVHSPRSSLGPNLDRPFWRNFSILTPKPRYLPLRHFLWLRGDTLLFARVGQRILPGGICKILVIPIFVHSPRSSLGPNLDSPFWRNFSILSTKPRYVPLKSF